MAKETGPETRLTLAKTPRPPRPEGRKMVDGCQFPVLGSTSNEQPATRNLLLLEKWPLTGLLYTPTIRRSADGGRNYT